MIFTLLGGRLGLLHLRDCGGGGGGGGGCLWRALCAWILWGGGGLLRGVVGKAGSGGGVRSNRFMGCTDNQLQNN